MVYRALTPTVQLMSAQCLACLDAHTIDYVRRRTKDNPIARLQPGASQSGNATLAYGRRYHDCPSGRLGAAGREEARVPFSTSSPPPFMPWAFFGSLATVELVARYHSDPQFSAEHSPLFGKCGLVRASSSTWPMWTRITSGRALRARRSFRRRMTSPTDAPTPRAISTAIPGSSPRP